MLGRALLSAATLAAALSIAPAAQAHDISLTLNDTEQTVLLGLLDTANKSGGLSNAQNAVYFLNKIQAAAATPAPEPTPAADKPGAGPAHPKSKPTEAPPASGDK